MIIKDNIFYAGKYYNSVKFCAKFTTETNNKIVEFTQKFTTANTELTGLNKTWIEIHKEFQVWKSEQINQKVCLESISENRE